MDFEMEEYKHKELTEKIIGCFYRVYNTLGSGFLEKIYENALALEFSEVGLSFIKQAPVRVFYKNKIMGDYFADFIVDGKVIVEVKALKNFCGSEEAQLINYLKATGIEVGLLLNFGKEAGIKRMVFEIARDKK